MVMSAFILTAAFLLLPVQSMNSINLDLEILENIDVSPLGTPNLDRYNGTYNFTLVNEHNDEDNSTSYRYILQIDFNVFNKSGDGNSNNRVMLDTPGPSNFEGDCSTNDNTGEAPDGKKWHSSDRKNWMLFSKEVSDNTGFTHVSLEFLPCGRSPAGLRQARYDVVFYTALPQYRAFMTCEEFKTPAVCQYNQSSHIGRSQFTIPRLVNDPDFLANMPLRFQPDPEFPEAFQYEGLTHYDKENIPNTTEDWKLPTFLMSTYDAEVISFRAMIPYTYIYGKDNAESEQSQYYVYQTMMGLPSQWSMSYDGIHGNVAVQLQGTRLTGALELNRNATKEKDENKTSDSNRASFRG